MSAGPRAAGGARLPAIDLARGAALVAMALFHLGRDMEVLGMVAPGTTFTTSWQVAARAIAGSFVLLAGASLWLAHGRGVRWRRYLRRLALLAAAAGAVSLATFLTFPAAWVRFGILHSIAASSVVAVLVMGAPSWALIAGGLALVAGAWIPDVAALSGPAWLWLGLGGGVPPMMDFEPLVPWTGPFLLGLGAAKAADRAGLLDALRGRPDGPAWRRLGWPGRHSLAIYLAHQPILFGALMGWQRLVG